ncbi:MAG: orotidine-5'-phosphate decarboxylase [Euryarchaeota archaeon]|nr:orotidine-5'-phosphate decarboxylase [Euryarchaeota archaeon]
MSTKIIVALDYTNPLDALEMTAKLRDVVDGFKINHCLWSQSVYIKDYTKDKELFMDLKLWDTPNTVNQVLQKIIDKGCTMTTICTHNNQSVFEAVQPFSKYVKLLAVTYLTSWTAEDRHDITNTSRNLMWRNHLDRISPYGFSGIICSASDIENIANLEKHYIKVCPGIQYETENTGQSRTTTPRKAKELGADYLVIGRSITQASDPVQTVNEIRESLNG